MNPTLGQGRPNSGQDHDSPLLDVDSNQLQRGDLVQSLAETSRQSNASLASTATGITNWRNSQMTAKGVYSATDESAPTVPIQEATAEDRTDKVLNLGRVTYASEKRRFSRPFIMYTVLVVLAILGLAIGVGVTGEAALGCSESGSGYSASVVAFEPDSFSCGNEDDDESIRQEIANKIQFAQFAGDITEAFLLEENIPCLPNKAFDRLNNQQSDQLKLAKVFKMSAVGLTEIKRDAFLSSERLFRNVEILRITQNGLSFIPSRTFEEFPNLKSLELNENAFVTLNNNIIGDGGFLDRISLRGNSGLISFPEFVGFQNRVTTVDISKTNAMIELEGGVLKDTDVDEILVSGNSRLLDLFEIPSIADILGFPNLPPRIEIIG